jgi:hypothetical protein
MLTLNHNRAEPGAVKVLLTAACDPGNAIEVPATRPGVRRYQRIEQDTGVFSATWYDQFMGGCITYRLHSATDPDGDFADETPVVLGLIARQTLQQALDTRSGGRLHLDPGTAS